MKKRYIVKLTDNEDFSSKIIKCNNLFGLLQKIEPFKHIYKTKDCLGIEDLIEKGINFKFEESGFETIEAFYNHTLINDFVDLVKAGDIMALDGEYVDTWTDICIVDTK